MQEYYQKHSSDLLTINYNILEHLSLFEDKLCYNFLVQLE